MRNQLLVTTLFTFLIFYSARAKTYTVRSLEGKASVVSLSYKPFSKKLSISFKRDTIYLHNYTNTQAVSILAGNFLQVTYGIRAGTGLALQNTALLCVVKDRLQVALLVQSYASGFSTTPGNASTIDKQWLNTLKFSVPKQSKANFELLFTIQQQQKSKLHPPANYTKPGKAVLRFDTTRYIFYSTRNNINQSFTLVDSRTNTEIIKAIKEIAPIITLGEDTYYFIANSWYSIGADNKLFKEYGR
ncbi:hypothetical protein [Hymenobacter cellulosilyticus]|uniref:Uncharacterized protein n=1 Tax=Hymenobacter cellulosilyticus TaxID=2932248 RepID=A0A8T9Q244_9BACT|nr:hypothetical protein [Hymenobacter cellulosilyticus]UOQ70531.1 hypothetical protein MUN79_17615 [Hymenobacter cellulosilyticus]